MGLFLSIDYLEAIAGFLISLISVLLCLDREAQGEEEKRGAACRWSCRNTLSTRGLSLVTYVCVCVHTCVHILTEAWMSMSRESEGCREEGWKEDKERQGRERY